jgi:hypothetical protein
LFSRLFSAGLVGLLISGAGPAIAAGRPEHSHIVVSAAAACFGSPLRVGDTLPSDPADPLRTVDDIYSIWGGPGGAAEIGWFYFGSDRKSIFLQYNYASIAAYGARALGIHLDSVASPGAFGTLVQWNHQRVADRYRMLKCTTRTNVG